MKELKRIREWMDIPGRFEPGPLNAVTDVRGVLVGHRTVVEGDDVRTGVTVISPADGDIYASPVPAAIVSGNGFGKLAGSLQVEELGEIESLIALTNTLSVPAAAQGLLDYHIPGMPEGARSINVVVGETNDGVLNDIKGLHVKPVHVSDAIKALSETVPEGSVGAGCGTICFGCKGGIGTSSRVVPGRVTGEGDFTVGALVQSNYGGNLNIYGRMAPFKPLPDLSASDAGSCMIVIATDAPVSSRQLKRFARRGLIGMTNTGSVMGHGSGDFCIAFSNYPENRRERSRHGKRYYYLSDSQLTYFFEAIADCVREALYNSMTMSPDMTSRGKTVQGLDITEFLKE